MLDPRINDVFPAQKGAYKEIQKVPMEYGQKIQVKTQKKLK